MTYAKIAGRVAITGLLLATAACSIDRVPSAPESPLLNVGEPSPSFAQVDAWFQTASAGVLGEPGAVFVDHDEEANKIRIGVEPGADRAALRKILARDRVPEGVVIIEETSPIVEQVTLQQLVRPVIGGLQLHWFRGTAGFFCTLGFNAFNPPDTRRSFITNSHCTRARGNVLSPTVYFQPLSAATIGVEVEDPPFFVFPFGGCPIGRLCRRSDAARAVYNTQTSTLGRIARTTFPGALAPGSITIAGPGIGTFRIVGEGPPVLNQITNKVGRTSGWTRGPVIMTNVNTNVSATNITMMGQDIVRAFSAGGDSGSPVFVQVTGFNFPVILRGIMWGGGVIGGLPVFVFSRISNVEAELGPLTTF